MTKSKKNIKLKPKQKSDILLIKESINFIQSEIEKLDFESGEVEKLEVSFEKLKFLEKKYHSEFKRLINYLNSQNLPLSKDMIELNEEYL